MTTGANSDTNRVTDAQKRAATSDLGKLIQQVVRSLTKRATARKALLASSGDSSGQTPKGYGAGSSPRRKRLSAS